jgi:hypothetical protein
MKRIAIGYTLLIPAHMFYEMFQGLIKTALLLSLTLGGK